MTGPAEPEKKNQVNYRSSHDDDKDCSSSGDAMNGAMDLSLRGGAASSSLKGGDHSQMEMSTQLQAALIGSQNAASSAASASSSATPATTGSSSMKELEGMVSRRQCV